MFNRHCNSAAGIAILLFCWVMASAQPGDDDKKEFERAALRFAGASPSSFRDLPTNLRRELDRRGCSVPQNQASGSASNVIQGSFRRADQRDWAVLCSVAHTSSVLVFWNGSEKQPAEIARSDDRRFFAKGTDGRVQFLREIRPVSYEQFASRTDGDHPSIAPDSAHLAIEDSFPPTGSVFFYFEDGTWHRRREVTGK